jgi:hypothetical protein
MSAIPLSLEDSRLLSLWLIALHMLGDYLLQTDWMAANKLKSAWARTVHVFVYTLGFIPLGLVYTTTLPRAAGFVLLVYVTHWITDCRRWASDKAWPPKPILFDQAIHLLTLAVLGSIFLDRSTPGFP